MLSPPFAADESAAGAGVSLDDAGASADGAGVAALSAGAVDDAAGAGAVGSAAGAGVAGASELAPGVAGADESVPLSHPARPTSPAKIAVRTNDRVILGFMITPSYCGWVLLPLEEPDAGASVEGAGEDSAGAVGSAAGAGAAGASDVAPGAAGSDPLSHPARPSNPAKTAVRTIDRVVLSFMAYPLYVNCEISTNHYSHFQSKDHYRTAIKCLHL